MVFRFFKGENIMVGIKVLTGRLKMGRMKTLATCLVMGMIACPMSGLVANADDIDYPDMEVGVFWNSDNDLSDTVYMSYNGSDFQQISTAYKTDGNGSSHVTGKPSYVNSIHDPSIMYKEGTFWILGGYTQNQNNLGWRFTPMLGSSKNLIDWSYPNSGSSQNLAPVNAPDTGGNLPSGQYDSAGTDGFIDDNGDLWIVTTLGYYGAFHGQSQKDIMHPYLVKATGLQPGGDPAMDPGAQPQLKYGDLTAIRLPDNSNNWLDPSLYKEDGTYYLSIKKNGVTNQIYSINDLSRAGDSSAWKLVNANVVTGYEGPSLTKYNGQYYFYTDKLKDYPYGQADGTAGTFVTQASSLSSGWHNTRRITTTNVDGRSIPNRHGTVITVSDPTAKRIVWNARVRAGYGEYRPGVNGWVTENGKRYWYDNGVKAVSKEVYDPDSDAWYWFDKDGSLATNKDVYIPSGDKWVRYDAQGHMIKGEDYRYGGWYYFNPTTGAMTKGMTYVPSNGGKWVYYDWTTGKMAHGETYVNYDAAHTGWYLFDQNTGAMFHGDTYVRSNGGKWVRYDFTTGKMVKGLNWHDNSWYYFDQATCAMQKGNVWVPEWRAWHWFDRTTGRG